jgi:hydroxymethylpyrimidine pyrophosphatase-like HAD family hydrolase
MAEPYPDLQDRPVKNTICLFDVDGTLTPARMRVSAEMLKLLSELRHQCAIGFVRQAHHHLPLASLLSHLRQNFAAL